MLLFAIFDPDTRAIIRVQLTSPVLPVGLAVAHEEGLARQVVDVHAAVALAPGPRGHLGQRRRGQRRQRRQQGDGDEGHCSLRSLKEALKVYYGGQRGNDDGV